MKKTILLLCFLTALHTICIGQITTPGAMQLPAYSDNIILPSPEAAQMVKYVDLPVTHSLGLVDISIPLYTIKGKEFDLPVSLSYHASGIKVEEKPGSAGLGWTFNGGGVIAREIRGIPDDHPLNRPIPAAEDLAEYNSTLQKFVAKTGQIELVKKIINGNQDSYYDVYKYTYPGGGYGSFIQRDDATIKLLSNDDTIIFIGQNGALTKAIIKDPVGNEYEYTVKEEVTGYTLPWRDLVSGLVPNNQGGRFTNLGSSWYLSRITSANKIDSYVFEYDSIPGVWKDLRHAHNLNYRRRCQQKLYQSYDNGTGFGIDVIQCLTQGVMEPYFLLESFTEYDIHRDYSAMRVLKKISYHHLDGNGPQAVINLTYAPYREAYSQELISMSVVNQAGREVRRIDFVQSGTDQRKLDSVLFRGTDGKIYDSYAFEYHSPHGSNLYAQDRFGYYNGKERNDNLLYRYLFPKDAIVTRTLKNGGTADEALPGTPKFQDRRNVAITEWKICPFAQAYIPKQNLPDGTIPYEDPWAKQEWEEHTVIYETAEEMEHKRDHSFEESQANTLHTIKRMSGAKTVFKYSPPEWAYTDADTKTEKVASIGLKIDSILTYDRNDKLVKLRTFDYSESGCTVALDEVRLADYMYFGQYSIDIIQAAGKRYFTTEYQTITLSSTPVLPGMNPDLARVFYEKVTETVSDGTANAANRVVTEYRYDCSSSIHQSKAAVKPHAEKDSAGGNGTAPIDIPPMVTGLCFHHKDPKQYDENAKYGPTERIKRYFVESPPAFNNLTSKTIYKTEDNGTLTMVQKDTTVYAKVHNVPQADDAGHVRTGLFVERLTANMGVCDHVQLNLNTSGVITDLTYSCTAPGSGKMNVYSGSGNEMRIDKLPEDCFYYNVMQSVCTTKPLYTVTTYSAPTGNHEQQTAYIYEDDAVYGTWPDGGGPRPAPVIDFDALDSQAASINPVRLATLQVKGEVAFRDGKKYYTRYLYPANYSKSSSANSTLGAYVPVGKETIVDDSHITASYTKYDKVNCPNTYAFPSLTGEKLINRPVKTISKLNGTITSESKILRYDDYGNPVHIIRTGEPETCYIWGYGGMYPVAVIRNATYDNVTAALGSAVIKEITSSPALSINDLVKLDNIRNSFYLSGAEITTYTYEPLVGITSVSDPSGRKLYYYYDPAGRLEAVRDEQHNLVETYEYKNIN